MKKLFTLVLILCLVLPCAFAENVKDLTDEELKALYIEVKAELMERKLWDEAILPAGIYVGGETLPEGDYELTFRSFGYVAAWKDYETYLSSTIEDTEHMIAFSYVDEGTKYTLSLKDGICWYIMSDAVVRPFTGLAW